MSGLHKDQPRGRALAHLCLIAVGIVYGDIGTSPLYAIRECFHGEHAVPILHDGVVLSDNVLGVLSLVFWTMVVQVALKYLVFVLHADNKGEGGILAMVALMHRALEGKRAWVVLLPMGLFGAALLYGDGLLTPAISVTSAIEGLEVATPGLAPYVVPITIAILVGLFMFQSRGTGGVGIIFGPITIVWFLLLAVTGLVSILQTPSVLMGINPWYAAKFFYLNSGSGFLVLGAVFLVATGGEALYADLGHFGRWPIQIDWFAFVMPALVLNYFGQGALLLRNPDYAFNPFYHMVPGWALYPTVVLAALATIIASQAVISGVFSLTSQAVQLGYFPRVKIVHTSSKEMGQVYLPGINACMMVGTILLVIGFQTSSNMASAYGVAIATTMVITSTLAFPVTYYLWKWKLWQSLAVLVFFLCFDLTFFSANIVKIAEGGWFPLLMGLIVYVLMTTWKHGRALLGKRVYSKLIKSEAFIKDLSNHPPVRVPGTAIFLTGNPDSVPLALVHQLNHNKTLHEHVIWLTLRTHEVPRIDEAERIVFKDLGMGCHQIIAHYGYMEEPNVPRILGSEAHGMKFNMLETTFFLGREMLLVSKRPGMMAWRKRIFIALSRNAQPVTSYFGIPSNRVIEIGAQVEL
ncbi:MAG: potassium transporter Kup [Phycisphaera sp.]|nr:potassium transporter Kup [Phycisphaera sp.]